MGLAPIESLGPIPADDSDVLPPSPSPDDKAAGPSVRLAPELSADIERLSEAIVRSASVTPSVGVFPSLDMFLSLFSLCSLWRMF